ncbi:MAG TPA: phage virion morphogenesis protein [Polyangiales bacterium]|nr:phage virion morphogenesis protein [Polyangiales bacterium]
MADIEIRVNELQKLTRIVREAAQADLFPLLDSIGQQQEDSARRRITETKRSPDGKRWAPWSERYRKTRKSHHSLLRSTGALVDSLDHQVEGDVVVVGSNLKYAGVHLFGSEDEHTPARSFLDPDGGFADSHDRQELRDIARDFMRGIL